MSVVYRSMLILAGLILFARMTRAQEYTHTFFNASNGLPTSEIISLARDHRGYLWIGTSVGLSQYDGFAFRNYLFTENHHFIGKVNCIREDDHHRLWLGTETGLFYFSDNQFHSANESTPGPQGVNDILKDKDGDMWLATEAGPVCIPDSILSDSAPHKQIRFADYLLNGWAAISGSGDRQRTTIVRKASDGTVFFANYEEIFRYERGTIKRVFRNINTEINFTILALFPVSRDRIYFDETRYHMHRLDHGKLSLLSLEDLYDPGAEADTGGIWYTGTIGMYKFHPGLEKISRYIDLYQSNILYPSDMLYDSTGFWWLATHDGLIKFNPVIFTNYNFRTHYNVGEVYSFTETSNGHFLLGANRGKVFEYRDGQFNPYPVGPRPVFPLAEIFSMYEDKHHHLWFGSGYQGLAVRTANGVRRFTEADGLHDNSIRYFLPTREDGLFAIGDHGMTRIIEEPGDQFRFQKIFAPLSSRSQHAAFYGAVEAPDHRVWIGGDEGLFYLVRDSLYHYLLPGADLQVSDIKKDRAGNIWVSTRGEGVLYCSPDSNRGLRLIRQYQEADGLNTPVFMKILVDDDDNIWLGSPKGISFIGQHGPYRNRIFNFGEADGLIKSGYSEITLYQAQDKKIWIGTSQGFASFDPGRIHIASTGVPVYITDVTLGDPKWPVARYARSMMNGIPVDLQLPYNRNSLSITYGSPEYNAPSGLRYYYKMDGADSGWQDGGNTRSVSYRHLRPGHYVFRVRTINEKGTPGRNEAALPFDIRKPFWLEWWFILPAAILVGGLIVLAYRRRVSHIRRRETQRTEMERLKAINYQYQLEIEQVVNFFATSINEQQTIDEMLWDVSRNCISKLGFEDCIIYLLDETWDLLIQKAAWGPKTSEENKILTPIEIPVGKGIVGHVAATGKPEIISDTSADPRYIPDDAFRYSELAVPIIEQGHVLGVIDSEHHQRDFYTPRHLQIMTTIASLCGEKMVRMRAEEKARRQELENLRLSSDLASSQLTALRAQMNPHFIFNALNSIQQFILQGNADEANRYLSRFSRLQRQILQNSDQQFIPLEKEKELLEIYLQLEQLRFQNHFKYRIMIDAAIEPDEIMIPPMIIQPFVENAIWHGLMPKKEDRELSVEFALEEEDLLICRILDNGIGRAAAARLRQDLQPHKSKGMTMVYERLRILEKQLNRPFRVEIQDLEGDDGHPRGTLVILWLYCGDHG